MDKTLISIEMIDGVKHVHYLGYGYYNGEPKDKPYRWVEYVFLMVSMTEVLAYGGLAKWEGDYSDSVKQYIRDLSEKEYDELEEHKEISYDDITADTPCGLYYLIK